MKSFATYGEDAVLEGIVSRLEWVTGHKFGRLSYIDIGGFHPEIHSNLYHFYRERGWRGSTFEPNPVHNSDFSSLRPDDALFNYAVAGASGDARFLVFSEGDTSNTINADFAARKEQAQGTPVQEMRMVRCVTLKEAIALHQEIFKAEIGVISIDAEGEDEAIIEAFDFSYRPLFFLIEEKPKLAFTGQSFITQRMKAHNFVPIASTVMTTVYIDNRHPFSDWIEKIGINDRKEGQ